MTDNTQPPGAADNPEPANESTLASATSDELLKIIKELRAENAKHRKTKKDVEAAKAQAEEASLVEQAKWKELAEKRGAELDALKPIRERYEALQETFKTTLQKRLEAIPEQYKSLVPEFDDPVKTMGWLETNSQLFAARIAPKLDAGAQGDGNPKAAPKLTPEQDAMRIAAGMTLEEYGKYLEKRPVTANIPTKVLGGGA